jgi:hypothetical protein
MQFEFGPLHRVDKEMVDEQFKPGPDIDSLYACCRPGCRQRQTETRYSLQDDVH